MCNFGVSPWPVRRGEIFFHPFACLHNISASEEAEARPGATAHLRESFRNRKVMKCTGVWPHGTVQWGNCRASTPGQVRPDK